MPVDAGAPGLLRRYRLARAEDILTLEWLTHGLQRLFAAPGPIAREVRNHGLGLVARLPILRGLLARRAIA
jgi:2-polyprenyl-6-methoxyphenol hydroxylase-like FAD-dependent oxidoreductase